MREAPSFWRLFARSLMHIAFAVALGQALLALGLMLVSNEAHAEWLPVTDTDLSIRPGNALDFSSLVEAGPAGKHGRVVASADGHFTFAGASSKRQRFMCASQPWGVEEGFPDHETADRYAEQLRLHGYNLARFHFVDNVLMSTRKPGSKDFDFDPEQLDRFYYFMAALKRAGVYWMMDALTSWNGAYGDVGGDRWADKHNVKLGVYTDPADQEHWKRMVDQLLASKNPYTGMSPLQDPALVAVITVNEGGLNSLIDHQRSPALNREFTQWVARRYGNAESASKRWNMGGRSNAPLELPQHDWNASERMQDVQRFYFDMQAKTMRWMNDYLRKQGYKGFISGYDNWFTSQDIASRAMLDLVAVHSYHDDPQGFASPGDSIKQSSSLQDELGYIRAMTVSRYWNKPFAVTEYDQPFWNRYRFESGIAMGAYAAFQDWDLICRHASGPIELDSEHRGARHRILYPYGIGVDPVARASETLAALLFLRGDVKPAKHRVTVRLTPSYVFEKQAGIGFLPPDVNRLGLLTGLGVQWDDGETAYAKNDLVIDPDSIDNTQMGKLWRKVGNMLGQGNDKAQQRVEQLKLSAILPKTNGSNAGAGTFESDTGQITLDAGKGVLRVATERTEAVAFDNTPSESLPHLKVMKSSEPALIAASSLDGAALGKSNRILLILATDARNSGMEFSDSSEKTLRKLGGSPVVIKPAQVRLQLQHDTPEKFKLFALKLNGERGGELPVKRGGKVLDIELDTAKQGEATTFFELVGP